MNHTQQMEQIRVLVAQSFEQLGSKTETSIRETILIREGCYCGRRFDQGGLEAVWFLESNEIKVYDADGSLAEVRSLAAATYERYVA